MGAGVVRVDCSGSLGGAALDPFTSQRGREIRARAMRAVGTVALTVAVVAVGEPWGGSCAIATRGVATAATSAAASGKRIKSESASTLERGARNGMCEAMSSFPRARVSTWSNLEQSGFCWGREATAKGTDLF